MMIVTRTKEVFMKRLKRNKKMLTEQGSSDQSRSNTMSKSIQLHTNTFLDSIGSSQLSRKTNELRDELFPQFKQTNKKDRSYDSSIHDIHNPKIQENQQIFKKQTIQENDTFVDKLFKLSKNISLTEMIENETVQVNLFPLENDVSLLICDFDQVDREKIMQDYNKLQKKYKKFSIPQTPIQEINRFRKKSRLNTTPNQLSDQNFNHQKTLEMPKYRRFPKQMQLSVMEKQLKSRNSYDMQNNYHPSSPTYKTTKNSLFINPSRQSYRPLQENYKTLQRYKPGLFLKPNLNENQIRHVYNLEEYKSRQKTNSYQQKYIQRQKSHSNMYHYARYPTQYTNVQQYQRRIIPQHQERFYQNTPNQGSLHPSARTSAVFQEQSNPHIRQLNPYEEKYVHQFRIDDNKLRIKSTRTPQNQLIKSHKLLTQKDEQKLSHLPLSTEKIIRKQHFANMQEKIVKNSIIEGLPPSAYYQASYQEKLQKKKKIRQKAAQLLSRVKSHQYLTTRLQPTYQNMY